MSKTASVSHLVSGSGERVGPVRGPVCLLGARLVVSASLTHLSRGGWLLA